MSLITIYVKYLNYEGQICKTGPEPRKAICSALNVMSILQAGRARGHWTLMHNTVANQREKKICYTLNECAPS